MPLNKKALNRYLVIDRCLRNPGRKYFFADLLKEVNEALEEEGTEGIGRTQLYKDLNDLEYSTYKAPIKRIREGRKVFFKYADPDYSISKQPLNEEEANQLRSALMVLSRFKGMPQFDWINEIVLRIEQSFKLKKEGTREVISFDSNEYLQGIEFIGPLFNAIVYNKVLSISYKTFQSEEANTFLLQPLHLKQYKNRWFVFSYNKKRDSLTTLALDRIIEITESHEPYQEIAPIDFAEYFVDVIGVTVHHDKSCETILLKFTPAQAPYILTKPLHGSQKTIKSDDEGLVISLSLIPNYELEKVIMEFGETVEVLEPEYLREQIKNRLREALERYK